jgi:hypothetical protein
VEDARVPKLGTVVPESGIAVETGCVDLRVETRLAIAPSASFGE